MVSIGIIDRETTRVPTALDHVTLLPYKVTYNVSQFLVTHQDTYLLKNVSCLFWYYVCVNMAISTRKIICGLYKPQLTQHSNWPPKWLI